MMKLRRIIITGLLLLCFIACFIPVACQSGPVLAKYEDSRNLMDTFFKVTIYAGDRALAEKAIAAAFARMEEIESVASVFDETAEAYRLNRDGYIDNPSPDLHNLISLAIEYNQLTDGYFDITVQPLLDLWSAGLWKEPKETQQARVDEMMKLVGMDKIEVTESHISLKEPGMKITLGGITKGYAVDEALKVLRGLGIEHALVAAGGDIGSLGGKPDGKPWNIALANPDDTQKSLATFQFTQRAISTSGNYERYFSPDKTVNHLMNPKTGYSVSSCISVTIIAPGNAQADALATSVFVMGPEAGMKLVESLPDVECFMVDASRNILTSSGSSKYLAQIL